MSEPSSRFVRNNNDRSSSPKRKKVRQKYAPKACVSCRRSKLKCSGDNPCQRCRDSGKRCFFSEDQTAAEALQNLSRPSLSQQQSTSTSTSNADNLTRRNLTPRHDNAERRPSDTGVLGLSMEARMARIESMMEVLLQERTMYTTPRRSLERDDSSNDMAMSMAMQMPHLMSPSRSFPNQASPQVLHPQDAIDPLLGAEMSSLRIGNQTLAFPGHNLYADYIDTFFRELQAFHPCVDEQLFRNRSEKMLSATEVLPNDVCFLGLNYIIFALYAAFLEMARFPYDSKPAGWHWLQLADDIIGQRQLYGQGDISLAQYFILKTLYYTLVDRPGLAYNTIGLASRYALQQGLNRQNALLKFGTREAYERIRVFWVISIVDRRTSLSCGRPYSIRDADIDLERPGDMHVQAIHEPHQGCEESNSIDVFLDYMVHWARFASSLWDSLLTAHVSPEVLAERVNTFEAAVIDFLDNTFANSTLQSTSPRRHQYIEISFYNIRLMAQRATASSLQFRASTTHLCARLAAQTLSHVHTFEADADYPVANVLQKQTIPSLTISLLLLCSLLVSDLSGLGLPLDTWIPYVQQSFDDIIILLSDRAKDNILARRVLRDFDRIIPVIQTILSRWATEILLLQSTPDWSLVQGVIPPNVAELLPYREQPPDIGCASASHEGIWTTDGGHLETDLGFSSWSDGHEHSGSRGSVLWV